MLKEVSKDEAMQAIADGKIVLRLRESTTTGCGTTFDLTAEVNDLFLQDARYLIDELETNITFTEPDVVITDGVKK